MAVNKSRGHLFQAGISGLPSTWDVINFESLLSDDRGISVGVMYPGEHCPGGVPLIKAGDLSGNVINPAPDFRISADKHHEYRRTKLQGGEIIMTLVGEVGLCAVVPPQMAGWNTARAVAVIRLTDPSDAYFVVCCLRSPAIQHIMDVWCNTTVQATLNLKEIRQLPLPWPPKRERDRIASTIKALDDKIELNRRMNRTLEAMSRAIFTSWFVDFDPVHAKAAVRRANPKWTNDQVSRAACPNLNPEIATLFPDSFEDSELGEIPKGWYLDRLGSVADVNWGDTSVTKAAYVDRGFAAFSATGPDGFLPYFDFDRIGVVVSAIGANSGATWLALGKWSCIKNTIRFWAVSQHVSTVHLFYATLGKDRWPKRGSAQPFISQSDSRNLPVLLPDSDLGMSFGRVVEPLMAKCQANEAEVRLVAGLRDILLPPLVSGSLQGKKPRSSA